MNNYISIRSINSLILWLFIVIGFSPLYGEESSCGLKSEQANETAAKNVQKNMKQEERLPVLCNAGFWNYSNWRDAINNKYYGCIRSDGKVFLMTYDASADSLQFAPYDPNNQPQQLSGTRVNGMLQLTFTDKSGDNASLGAEGL